MIVKKREIPRKLQVLEALIRRLSMNHPRFSFIQEEYAKRLAGYHGERQVDYQLNLLPQKPLYIFHDLRLPHYQHYFQIDTLLITENYAVILEVKNFTGTLVFDEHFKQLIRTADGKEEGFQSPLVQAENQRRKLKEYLQQHQLPSLPVESLIVISHPGTIIKADNDKEEVSQKVIHSEFLAERLDQLKNNYAHSPSFPIEKVFKHLLTSHTELTAKDYLFKGINKKDIRTGVQCPECKKFSMKRLYNNWYCPFCSSKSKDAHLQALNDYLLLVNPSITNNQCQKFLHINRHLAKRILSKNLKVSGYANKRVYFK
ncbi:nuclease-related domain-containing protein [Virgibacillus senegalensis]|uniref:nuclease-related domain-containing protein n=1 Tax=Virgibacillus senegalensis TaxID=1499679 RepID=UPI00069F3678|nr:nuclease-related domain-containing protein [Virgibacillus senegalensis]